MGRPWPAAGQPLFRQEDTDLALALHELERAEAANRCPLCGLAKDVCRDKANQLAFRADYEQCHATWAIVRARAGMAEDSRINDDTRQAAAWTASLPPSVPQ